MRVVILARHCHINCPEQDDFHLEPLQSQYYRVISTTRIEEHFRAFEIVTKQSGPRIIESKHI